MNASLRRKSLNLSVRYVRHAAVPRCGTVNGGLEVCKRAATNRKGGSTRLMTTLPFSIGDGTDNPMGLGLRFLSEFQCSVLGRLGGTTA